VSATSATSGRGIFARVAVLVAMSAFALLTFADGSYATESELVPAAAPTDGKTVEVAISNFTFTPNELTIAPGTTVKWVNRDEIPHLVAETDVIATQIRSQGFGCNQPTTAERDRLASIPDEGVWLLQCEDGGYRVRLIPHMAAKVERVGQ
jgi:plastocyanin